MGLHANRGRIAALCASVLLATACTSAAPEEDAAGPVPTVRPEATPSTLPSPGPCATPRRASPPDVTPRYDMSLRIDPDAGTVTGTSDVTFVAERSTRRLVFRLWPNGPRLADEGSELVVEDSFVAGGGRASQPDPTTLVFELPGRLRARDPVTARLRWRLELPGAIKDRISQNGDAIRLGSFFPILSWEGGRGWATDPPTTTLAESSTSPTADFGVTIDAPAELDVIATGRETSPGHWVAEDVRDFAVAVGRFESVVETVETAHGPVNVTVGVAEGVDAHPGEFAEAIERALQDLSRRYGAYPWPELSMAIVPDLGASGIEYPAMIFQGEDSLENATTHEVAHSWFYGLVGNNQARDPWLDEGVTSWAQARGDGLLGFFRDYEIPEEVAGGMGRPMTFWDGESDVYYPGVYVQGAKALDALGDPRLVDCALKRYVAQNAYRVATTADLVRALRRTFPDARRVLERFGARP